MDSLTVGLGDRSYQILFGHGILGEIGALCRAGKFGSRVAVITNPTVGAHYFETVRTSFDAAGFTVYKIEMPDGEKYKNSDTLLRIYDKLISCGLDRTAFIAALGGGVVGDMAGFAAATYLRGIPFVQIPTTLLAQVDSSVGGKTGINHPKGKNLIGAFYQPRLVMIDVALLDTLPEREYLGGMAEVVKYGIVLDRELFDYIRSNAGKLLTMDTECLLHVIQRSCRIKASIVEKDEREAGLRAVLNYGHTFGHAVETLTGYVRYIHGEAVAIGMAQAAVISEAMGVSSREATEKIIETLKQLHLPVDLPPFGADAYADALTRDKKVRDGGLNFVLNSNIGGFEITRVKDVNALLRICGVGG